MPTWEKLGNVYTPDPGRHPRLVSHAANPLPVHLAGDVFRVFYSGRDVENRSSVGAVDIDIATLDIVEDHAGPIFTHGEPGSFHADGVSIANCYRVGERRYMLFMGWQAPADGHWRGDIGRLSVAADLSLSLDGDGPLLGSNREDPISLSYPWVIADGRDGFRMWYGSTVTWDGGNGEMVHILKEATSSDGSVWTRTGRSVPHELGVAQAFSRPTVAANPEGGLDMWFSYRDGTGRPYRIGYARDHDGSGWTLDLQGAGIDVSPDGWDSEMIEYPFVFDHADSRYMLYNGNGYGRTGFGLARLA